MSWIVPLALAVAALACSLAALWISWWRERATERHGERR